MIQACYPPDTRHAYVASLDEPTSELGIMRRNRRLGALLAVAGLAAIGITALPGEANAWWRGGWCCGVGFGVVVPPVVVAPPVYAPPPVYYAPPPAYYAPPQAAWIPPHWQGNVWVPGHWS
jgi:hypothetical protein